MNFAADAMAEAVAEFLAEPGLVDHVAGDAVGLQRGDAGAQEVDRRVAALPARPCKFASSCGLTRPIISVRVRSLQYPL